MVLSPLDWESLEVHPLQVGSAVFSWNYCRSQQTQGAPNLPLLMLMGNFCCRASQGAWGRGERTAWMVPQGQR